MENLSTAFSILLFIVAIHFLLKGISYRKIIDICKNMNKTTENFNSEKCLSSEVVGSNTYVNNENDSNFESNILDRSKFYKNNEPEDRNLEANNSQNINLTTKHPDEWKYKDEFVMNGGEIMCGVTGLNDNLNNYYDINTNSEKEFGNCFPFTKSSILDDDIRMGMGNKL